MTEPSDHDLRGMALQYACRVFEAMASNKLLVGGRHTEQDILGAAQLFYAFLKGEAREAK